MNMVISIRRKYVFFTVFLTPPKIVLEIWTQKFVKMIFGQIRTFWDENCSNSDLDCRDNGGSKSPKIIIFFTFSNIGGLLINCDINTKVSQMKGFAKFFNSVDRFLILNSHFFQKWVIYLEKNRICDVFWKTFKIFVEWNQAVSKILQKS